MNPNYQPQYGYPPYEPTRVSDVFRPGPQINFMAPAPTIIGIGPQPHGTSASASRPAGGQQLTCCCYTCTFGYVVVGLLFVLAVVAVIYRR